MGEFEYQRSLDFGLLNDALLQGLEMESMSMLPRRIGIIILKGIKPLMEAFRTRGAKR